MLKELYTNCTPTTLNTTINNSTTTVVCVDASTFPSANFRIIIESEIMFVTSRSTNTLTVIRGAEGTTAASHNSGVAINHIVTAGTLDAIKADLYAVMGHGRVPTSGNTLGDEFDDENFSGWTAVNSGSAPTATVTEQDKFCSIVHPGGGSAAQFLSWMKDKGSNLAANDWISICFRWNYIFDGYPQPQLMMADGVTYGSGNQCGYGYSPREHTYMLRGMTNYNNQTSFTGNSTGYTVDDNMPHICKDTHMKLVYKGSNQYDTYWSPDGVSWVKMHNNTNPQNFTPRYVGFGFSTWAGANPGVLSIRNFRTSF